MTRPLVMIELFGIPLAERSLDAAAEDVLGAVRRRECTVDIVPPIYIGSRVRIESGASIIGPSWIDHGRHIESGALVTRSVLFQYTHVAASATCYEAVMSPEYCVDRSGKISYVDRGGEESRPSHVEPSATRMDLAAGGAG